MKQFFENEFIERWGRGIRLIQEKEPGVRFKVVADIFFTTFERKGSEKSSEKAMEEGSETTQKTVEKTVEKILAEIRNNPAITTKELMKATGLTRRGIEWNISNLKKKGILKRIGPDKGGFWEVSK